MLEPRTRLVNSVGPVYSTISAGDLKFAVQARYGVGPLANCHLLNRGLNDVYRLEAGDGRRYIARLSTLRDRGPPNADFEAALLAHLNGKGCHASPVIATLSGAACCHLQAPEGDRALMLFGHFSGHPPVAGSAEIETLGAALAALHTAAETYSGPSSRYVLDLDHLLRQPLARLIAAPTMTEAMAAQFRARAAEVEIQVAAAQARLTPGICHGDCHGTNTFVLDEPGHRGQIGFFDFDDCGPGLLAYDLAVYLWALCGRSPTPVLGPSRRRDWQRFMDGYLRVRPLAQPDYDAIALFVPVRHFWFLGEYASRLPEWGLEALSERCLADTLRRWRRASRTPPLNGVAA